MTKISNTDFKIIGDQHSTVLRQSISTLAKQAVKVLCYNTFKLQVLSEQEAFIKTKIVTMLSVVENRAVDDEITIVTGQQLKRLATMIRKNQFTQGTDKALVNVVGTLLVLTKHLLLHKLDMKLVMTDGKGDSADEYYYLGEAIRAL